MPNAKIEDSGQRRENYSQGNVSAKIVPQTKQTEYVSYFRSKRQTLYPISVQKYLKMTPGRHIRPWLMWLTHRDCWTSFIIQDRLPSICFIVEAAAFLVLVFSCKLWIYFFVRNQQWPIMTVQCSALRAESLGLLPMPTPNRSAHL